MIDNNNMQRDPLDPDFSAVKPGTPVITMDGQRLGTVKQTQRDGLLVQPEGGQGGDYLVTPADMSRIDSDGVHLIINTQQAMRAQEPSGPNAGRVTGMPPGTDTNTRDASQGQQS